MNQVKQSAAAMTLALFAVAEVLAAGRVSVTCPTASIDEYRRLAEYAKSIGATHLDACQVEPTMWQWDRDRTDPYPNWSMVRPSITKFIVHDKLKKYIPADYVARNLANLKQRAAILKEFGLKSTFWGFEPAYLPEEAYVDHPDWRGPRCDHPRRSRTEYYAPCTDNPEIRAMYVDMVAELCKVCPFEAFRFRVNDSGSGICWSLFQYPGPNGRECCRFGDYSQRVVDFMSLFQEGAAKAGLDDVKVNSRMNLGPALEPGVIAKLKPGQSVNNRTASGRASEMTIGFPNRFLDYTVPVEGLSRVVMIARQLQEAQRSPGADLSIGLRSLQEQDTLALLRLYLHRPMGDGPAALGAAVEAVAAEFVGESHKREFANALYDLERAITHLDSSFDKGGHIFLLGTVHQRWLTRPLVCFPEELTPEEKDYYRRFQFQAQGEKEANDLLDLQGTRWMDGYGGMELVKLVADHAVLPLGEKVLATFRAMVPFAVDEKAQGYLEALVDRAELYFCLVRNMKNVVAYQYHLDTVDRSRPPHDDTLDHSCQGDKRLYEIESIARAEIDNTQKIIDILRRAKLPVIQTTPRVEDETIMTFGPNLVEQLEKKIAIMQRHRHDPRRLLPCKNQ